jgi:copine 5/8/9
MDIMSKSDPFGILYVKAEKETIWKKLGKTETLRNNLDPHFLKEFLVDYYFEKNQMLKVEIFDDDDNDDDKELIGFFECYMNKLLTAPK